MKLLFHQNLSPHLVSRLAEHGSQRRGVDKKTLAPETLERLREFAVRQHDIAIGRRGEMGRCAVVPGEMNGWLCGTGCLVIRLNHQCDPQFMLMQAVPQAP